MRDLGVLKKVGLRQVWTNEATNLRYGWRRTYRHSENLADPPVEFEDCGSRCDLFRNAESGPAVMIDLAEGLPAPDVAPANVIEKRARRAAGGTS